MAVTRHEEIKSTTSTSSVENSNTFIIQGIRPIPESNLIVVWSKLTIFVNEDVSELWKIQVLEIQDINFFKIAEHDFHEKIVQIEPISSHIILCKIQHALDIFILRLDRKNHSISRDKELLSLSMITPLGKGLVANTEREYIESYSIRLQPDEYQYFEGTSKENPIVGLSFCADFIYIFDSHQEFKKVAVISESSNPKYNLKESTLNEFDYMTPSLIVKHVALTVDGSLMVINAAGEMKIFRRTSDGQGFSDIETEYKACINLGDCATFPLPKRKILMFGEDKERKESRIPCGYSKEVGVPRIPCIKNMYIYDIETEITTPIIIKNTLKNANLYLDTLSFTPDGSAAYSYNENGKITVLDTTTGIVSQFPINFFKRRESPELVLGMTNSGFLVIGYKGTISLHHTSYSYCPKATKEIAMTTQLPLPISDLVARYYVRHNIFSRRASPENADLISTLSLL